MEYKTFSEGINTEDSQSSQSFQTKGVEWKPFKLSTIDRNLATRILRSVREGKLILSNFPGPDIPITETMFKKAKSIATETFYRRVPSTWPEHRIKSLKALLEVKYPKILSTPAVKSTATKLIKHLASKDGLKLSAKILARAVSWFTKVSFPALWAMDIYDMINSPEVKERWKELGDQEWWKQDQKYQAEKAVREMKARLESKKRERSFSEPNMSIPLGEYYNPEVGWY